VGSPGPETALHAGDRVIVKGSPAAVAAMRSLLDGEEL
jgi:K+/H+ antiporter YhaU regulatory subunit KhtT